MLYGIDVIVCDSDNDDEDIKQNVEIFGNKEVIVKLCSDYVFNKIKNGYKCYLTGVRGIEHVMKSGENDMIVVFDNIKRKECYEILSSVQDNLNTRKEVESNREEFLKEHEEDKNDRKTE